MRGRVVGGSVVVMGVPGHIHITLFLAVEYTILVEEDTNVQAKQATAYSCLNARSFPMYH